MAGGNVKLFSITTVFFAICAILFFGLSVTSLQKYTAQRERVHNMEQKFLAGKKEIMKVPEMIGKLRTAHKESKSLQSTVAELTETNDELTSELEETQSELTVVSIAKAVLEIDRDGYTKNLIEAREAVEVLRNQLSTNDGGMSLYDIDDSTESLSDKVEEMEDDLQVSEDLGETEEGLQTSKAEEAEEVDAEESDQGLQTSGEETHSADSLPDVDVTESEAKVSESSTNSDLQETLESIRNIILSSQFSYSQVERNFLTKKLNTLLDQAKGQAAESAELLKVINEFAEKASSSDAIMQEVLASLDKIQSQL
ncbi:MAG: hypothetical protein MRK01_02075 [Candidatus Scalindua sp.]|nr:hypothetical protein [Candidatus Scalindua sp.]